MEKARVYVRGINRRVVRQEILDHFGAVGDVVSLTWSDGKSEDKSEKRQGYCWVEYPSGGLAQAAVQRLHHSQLCGTVLSVGIEISKEGADITSGFKAAIVSKQIRPLNPVEEYGKKRKREENLPQNSVQYSCTGVVVDGVEYPIPQGLYIFKLLSLSRNCSVATGKLLDVVLEKLKKFGNKHTKELSESMGMVNSVLKIGGIKGINWNEIDDVVVYVIGDGQVPLTALVMSLFFPTTWKFVSIDPLMDFDTSTLDTEFSSRIRVVKAMSQHYTIDLPNDHPQTCSACTAPSHSIPLEPSSTNTRDMAVDSSLSSLLSSTAEVPISVTATPTSQPPVPASTQASFPPTIVIACHSHAPLEEFWARVPAPKYCVSMPCCGKTWSDLSQPRMLEYDDYEIYSPKRHIVLYETALSHE